MFPTADLCCADNKRCSDGFLEVSCIIIKQAFVGRFPQLARQIQTKICWLWPTSTSAFHNFTENHLFLLLAIKVEDSTESDGVLLDIREPSSKSAKIRLFAAKSNEFENLCSGVIFSQQTLISPFPTTEEMM
uniref:Uncharacterized protein n=1 Tax=Pyxicephalus adspersus TaxID=30357 RepID=A0AAV3B9A0_PYXAD|nr:TPA: hypothetical protein GDO54_001067 [Pyxicephalus adspersus]